MTASHYLTYIAFALTCLALLTLPFIPAFREWLYPTDVSALPVSANYTNDINYFSRRLHADAAAKLGLGPPTGYEAFEFVEDLPAGMDWRAAGKRLISRESIHSGQAVQSLQPVFVDGSIRTGAGSAFSALYATGDIDLGENSEIGDWAHAEGVLYLGQHSAALRRISAGKAIGLGMGAWFERLQAPLLHFGSRASSAQPLQTLTGHTDCAADASELRRPSWSGSAKPVALPDPGRLCAARGMRLSGLARRDRVFDHRRGHDSSWRHQGP